jgi:hypothetical protein
MSDTPTNPTPFRLSPGGTAGFDYDGERVAITWPECHEPPEADFSDAAAARVRQETIARFLDWITRGEHDAKFIGRRCIVLAFKLHLPSAPATLSELAARLGVSKTRAHQIVSELNGENTDSKGIFAENAPAD